MQRVSVIGCPGAGKSVFSAKLHKITKLPLVYLDSIYHDPKLHYKTDDSSWQNRIVKETSKPEWIIDGDFVDTVEARFKSSDTIIFLDFPTHTSLYHAVRRRLDYRRHPRIEMPKHWKERLPLEFLGYILTYRKNERPKTIKMVNEWKQSKNVLVFHNIKQAEDYLKTLAL